MSDNGQPDEPSEMEEIDPEEIDPEVIQEAIKTALEDLGIDTGDMGEVLVAQVSGPEALHVMHNLLGGNVTGPETNWFPRFLSDMVLHSTTLTMAARVNMSLEELVNTEEDIVLLAEAMPEMDLEDHEAYRAWKQEAEQLIVVIDKAAEIWRDNAN